MLQEAPRGYVALGFNELREQQPKQAHSFRRPYGECPTSKPLPVLALLAASAAQGSAGRRVAPCPQGMDSDRYPQQRPACASEENIDVPNYF
eukprot:1157626-Pelagomonas_calceolata.AAC.2